MKLEERKLPPRKEEMDAAGEAAANLLTSRKAMTWAKQTYEVARNAHYEYIRYMAQEYTVASIARALRVSRQSIMRVLENGKG